MMRTALLNANGGAALLLASLALMGCAEPGKSRTTATLDIMPPHVEVTHESDNTGTTVSVDAGPDGEDYCFELDWVGSDGSVLTTTYATTDGSGHFSTQVPVGTVRMEGIYYKCPDLNEGGTGEGEDGDGEANGGSRGGMPEHALAQGVPPRGTGQEHARGDWMGTDLDEFVLIGMPLGLSSAFGERNLSYRISVRASSVSHARTLASSILAGGVGTPAPEAVTVLEYTTLELAPAGARVRCAAQGTYQEFEMDFNDGAFQASLAAGTNIAHYGISGWDIVEMMVPESAIEMGSLPGVAYRNELVSTFVTTELSSPATIEYTYTFWD